MDLSGKKVMILGQGVSGSGAKKSLEKIAHPYFFTDESCLRGQKPDLIVTSPGIGKHIALDYGQKNGIEIIDELELGYILSRVPIVAVTGTNGKTTVTRLIGQMCATQMKAAICGNIGKSFSACAMGKHQLAIVEASSFQLSRCNRFRPKIAVVTNITPDHLDRHATMEQYISAKFRICARQQPDDFLILPYAYAAYVKNVGARVIYSDLSGCVRNNCLFVFEETVAQLQGIKLFGNHNLSNIIQSAIAAKLLGISNENIQKTIENFVPDPHRLQKIAEKCGKNWFDDSKATNIDSCVRACESMNGSTALILGGSDKGYEYDELFLRLPQNIDEIFVMGEVVGKLKSAAKRCGVGVKVVNNLQEAVHIASQLSVKNVLLSPAAASFDQYTDYAQRGKHFEALVQDL